MQNFEILLNNKFTAITQSVTSELQLLNDYYSYISKNGGGIVNSYNVRGYLNDQRNQQITADFFSYLTGKTTQDQALNILSSDKKLSDIFNDYYQRIFLSASQLSSTATIDQNLTGATQIIGYTYNHPWSGAAISKQLTGITQDIAGTINSIQSEIIWNDFTEEESYYVPVYIERTTNQLTRYKHDLCDIFVNKNTAGFYPKFSGITGAYFGQNSISNIISNLQSNTTLFSSVINTGTTADTRIHTLLDCFVDINLETNENVNEPAELLKVSFEFSSYTMNEGTVIQVKVVLDKPSISGIEQAVINLITGSASLGVDFTSSLNYPVTLAWNIGEQFKILTFTTNNDFLLEGLEAFNLQISNIINLDPGNILNTLINVIDTTILRTVSLSVAPPKIPFSIIPGANGVNINEGDTINLTVNLDGPAFGVETIGLRFAPSVNLIAGGTITSGIIPTVGSDFIVSGLTLIFNFSPGETQKTFNFKTLIDSQIEPNKDILFEIYNPQFCLIDKTQQVIDIKIQDTVSGSVVSGNKYVHLNLGKIYSVFGDGLSNTLMRQINPQPGISNYYNPIYVTQYSNYLIEYNTTINFRDYNTIGNSDSIKYNSNTVKLKITNNGIVSSSVNNILLNVGQTTIIDIPTSDFILTATTNSNKNTITNFFDYANYKIEFINNYVGSNTNSSINTYPGMTFDLRDLSNTISTTKTIDLGLFSLSGMTTISSATTNQYRLKSKYKNVNTARENTSSGFVCPAVGNFFTSVNFSQFYANTIENVSILGIMFLNFDNSTNYSFGNFASQYNTFEFVSGITNTALYYTCPKNNSIYNNLDYISLPFKIEP